MIPIASMIQSSGYQAAFLWFGLGQGIVVILVALLLRAPQPGEVVSPATPAVQQTRRDYGPAEVLKTSGILGHVCDVRDGRRRRSHGNRPACADCQRLQDRERAGFHPRTHSTGAYLRA